MHYEQDRSVRLEEVLPMRYLGIPIYPSKWSKLDYKLIIDKVSARIQCWTGNLQAGRVQLMKLVLMSLHSHSHWDLYDS